MTLIIRTAIFLAVSGQAFLFLSTALIASENSFRIGCGSTDITGPAAGFSLDGYVKKDRYSKGIHLRQRARAFIIAEPNDGNRLVFVCAELSKINPEIYEGVIERLKRRFGNLYFRENVILSATHTHSGTGGLWRYGADGPLGKGFYHELLEATTDQIVAAIEEAHQRLQPGQILVARGEVPEASAQRSSAAYRNNPREERDLYPAEVDTDLTLLKFISDDSDEDLGTLNWFAVHPTSMTYDNYLITGDSKGYASLKFERSKGVTFAKESRFVAAFAQTNCGDVTGNLKLNNTGPGKDDFESTRIIGQRQLEVAQELYENATEELSGTVDVRQAYVDFSKLSVADEFTKAGTQITAAAAYGYSFAAGSTEDGGGHPLFREGMKIRNPAIDLLSTQMFPKFQPDDRLREFQMPKAILFAPGVSKTPTGMSQVLPLSVCRIGQLVLVVGPAEFTTMSGRRIRRSVQKVFGDLAKYIVIAGYSNDYGGYVTTREEYEMQQYEGGHTLFGPWTLAGYQQEYVRLARALVEDFPATPVANSTRVPSTHLPLVKERSVRIGLDIAPKDGAFGDIALPPNATYEKRGQVKTAFWTGHPRNSYQAGGNFLTVERQNSDTWTAVCSDADWETQCRWQPHRDVAQPCQIQIIWNIPEDVEPGVYRVVHHGRYRVEIDEPVQSFDSATKPFRVD